MGIKIAHISDIHFRGLNRHAEYTEYSNRVFQKLRDENIDLIWIGGDIAHSKVQGITPEFIKIIGWWFTELAKIAPTHVMLGNHDGLVHNLDRLDAISPILDALNNSNIFLYKNSGTYTAKSKNGEVDFCVFSPFDNRWELAKPSKDRVSIACYHGVVHGAQTDSSWALSGGKPYTMFSDYDYAFLGDIHKMQELDNDGRIAYSGSYIQQNFGEEIKKGFLVWDIESKQKFNKKYVTLESSKPYLNFIWYKDVKTTVSKGLLDNKITSIPENARIRIQVPHTLTRSTIKSLESHLRKIGHNGYVKIHKNIGDNNSNNYNNLIVNKSVDLFDIESHRELFVEWVSTSEFKDSFEEQDTQSAMSLLMPILEDVKRSVESPRNIEWSIKRIEWDNIFAYGKDNCIDFTTEGNGIYGIFGPNGVGKSTVAAVIMYALYNSTDRGAMSNGQLINSNEESCEARVYMQMAGEDIRVTRRTEKKVRKTRGTGDEKEVYTTSLDLHKLVDEKWEDLSGEQRRDTDNILRELIGTADDFTTISLSSQGKATEFVEYGGAKKRDALVHLLDLKHIESFYKTCREKSNEDRAALKYLGTPEDINKQIKSTEVERQLNLVTESNLESEIENLYSKLETLKSINTSDTASRWKILTNKSSSIENSIADCKSTMGKLDTRLKSLSLELDEKRGELSEELGTSTLESLEIKYSNLKEIIDNRKILLHKLELLNKEKDNYEKKQKLLNGIPCGELYPTCPYIKDAFMARDKISEIVLNIDKTKNLLNQTDGYDDKLRHCEIKINKIKTLSKDIEFLLKNIDTINADIGSYQQKLELYENEIADLKNQILELSNNNNSEDLKVQKEIKDIEDKIKNLQVNELVKTKSSIAMLSNKIELLNSKLNEIVSLEEKVRIWDMLSSYVSPSGATQMIIRRQLPVINSIISETIDDSIDFSIHMKMEENSKTLDVFLRFPDGERNIETASGMQKLISAIAIRAALYSITPIPKCDMLIIDEGFGALDADNLESCLSMFEMYKKTYKNIILISHIDSVKEAAEIALEVGRKNGRSILRYE